MFKQFERCSVIATAPIDAPVAAVCVQFFLHVSSSALHETRSALNCFMLLLISSIITAIGCTVAVRSAACCVRLFISVSPFSALGVAGSSPPRIFGLHPRRSRY